LSAERKIRSLARSRGLVMTNIEILRVVVRSWRIEPCKN
jgi:hypothetical protein